MFSLERLLIETFKFSVSPRGIELSVVGCSYVNQVGLLIVYADFQLPNLSGSGLKVPGGGVWCGVVGLLRLILVFSLSPSQASQ